MRKLYPNWGMALSMALFCMLGVSGFGQIGFTVDQSSGCAPLTVTFTNTSGDGDVYEWNFDDGSPQWWGTDTSHTYTGPGEYYVRMMAFDTAGGGWNYLGEQEMIIRVNGLSWAGPVYPSACPMEDMSFDYGGNVDSIMWYFGDGDSSNIDRPNHAYTMGANYQVTALGYHSCGVDTMQSMIMVDSSSMPSSNFRFDPYSNCPNDEFRFEFDGTPIPNWSYTWDMGDGSPNQNGQNANHAYLTTGNFVVTLTVQNSCGNSSMTTDTARVMNPMPWNSMGLDGGEGCPGDPVDFYIWSSGGGNGQPSFQTYAWDFGDGSPIDSSANPGHMYADTGVYNVSLTVTNGCGMDTTLLGMAQIGDSVYPTLHPNSFGATNEDADPCPGDTMIFYTSAEGHISWDFGDGNSAVATEQLLVQDNGGEFYVTIVKHAYASIGNYTATITVTNGCGLSAIDSLQVNIGSGAPADADFVVTAPGNGPNYMACESVEFLGIGGGIYEWDFGDGNSDSTANSTVQHTYAAGGTYNVVLTVTNGCGNSDTYSDLVQIDQMDINGPQVDNDCFGDANGSIDLTVSNGVHPLTFDWSNGATSEDISGLSAGWYGITVTDANGCSVSDSTEILEPAQMVLNLGATQSTCLTANGSVGVIATGGAGPYTYSWTPGGATADTVTGLAAGLYTVDVTDANGCMMTDAVAVNDAGAPSISIDSVVHNLCAGDTMGSIDITVTGGTPSYTVIWSNGDNAMDPQNLGAGAYGVTVSDVNGCVVAENVIVNEPQTLMIDVQNVLNMSCHGVCDGKIDIAVVGGVGPYSHVWTSTDTNFVDPGTLSLNGLCQGEYLLTVTDANGCMTDVLLGIAEPTPLVASLDTVVNATCNGMMDGYIDITVAGGSPVYDFYWSNGDGSEDISNLGAGMYSLEVMDMNGCMDSLMVTVTEPTMLEVKVDSSVNINCFGKCEGKIFASAIGGTGVLQVDWDIDGTGDYDDDLNLDSLCSGIYNVSVMDANGCMSDTSVMIGEPTQLVLTVDSTEDNTCYGGTIGEISTTVTGGVTPYSVMWNNGETTEDLSGLSAGQYIVDVADANGCMVSDTVDISEPTMIDLTLGATQSTCLTANGSVGVFATGGTGAYTYAWSPGGATTDTVTGLAAGVYSVDVTDANGCMMSANVSVNDAGAPSISSTVTNVTCNGNADGSISVVVTGGTPGYSYSWPDGGAGTDTTGLAPGTYDLTVTDGAGCVASESYDVTEPDQLVAMVDSIGHVSCNGVCDGWISVSVSGGTGAYTYNWMPLGVTTEDITGLCAGTYDLTVTDANGCTVDLMDSIMQPDALTLSISGTDITCNGNNDGMVDATVSGGTMPYMYNWSSGSMTEDLDSLMGGDYVLTVTDANGCETIDSVMITDPASIMITGSSTDVSCNGDTDGMVTTSISGGTVDSTYQISWSSNGTSFSDPGTANLSNVEAADYAITVVDDNGCMESAVFTVGGPAAISIAIAGTDITCYGDGDGSAVSTVTGGAGGYSLAWSNGESTANISNLSAGTYDLVVTDSTGCMDSSSITISEPTSLVALANVSASTCGNMDGSAWSFSSGGTMPYIYSWSNGDSTDTIAVGAGMYELIITDANGCMDTTAVTVNDAGSPSLSTTASNVSCNGGMDGSVDLTVIGGAPQYTYAWSNGDSSEDPDSLAAGTYDIVVTDSMGCVASLSVVITEPTALDIALTSMDASCHGLEDGSVVSTVSGGTSIYAYSWSSGQSSQNLTGVGAGNYVLTVTDSEGCTLMDSIMVNEPAALTTPSVSQVGDSLMSSMAPFYQWNDDMGSAINGENDQYFAPSANGYYSVTITDTNGCSVTSDTVLFQFSGLEQFNSDIEITMYPVPVGDELTVALNIAKSSDEVEVILLNAIGEQMNRVNLGIVQGTSTTTIDFSRLPHGVYFVAIQKGDEMITKRVIH